MIANTKRCDDCGSLPPALIFSVTCGRCKEQSEHRRQRLEEARELLQTLSENGLTPYRSSIRDWLAQSD